jgi:hypothetical protein
VDPEELARIEDSLRGILGSAGLSWIADQVDGAVREEHPVAPHMEETSAGYVAWEAVDGTSPTSTMSFSHYTTEPYSAAERVALLVRAIRRAVIDAAQVDLAVAHFAAEPPGREGQPLAVRFVDELDPTGERTITTAEAGQRAAHVQSIADALEEIARRVEQ